MNEEKKPLFALAIVTLLAIGGLVVLFDNNVTGAISGQQTAYARIYGMRYHSNPCGLIDCHTAGNIAVSLGRDPATGNEICKCPNQPVAYYQVSHWTKQ